MASKRIVVEKLNPTPKQLPIAYRVLANLLIDGAMSDSARSTTSRMTLGHSLNCIEQPGQIQLSDTTLNTLCEKFEQIETEFKMRKTDDEEKRRVLSELLETAVNLSAHGLLSKQDLAEMMALCEVPRARSDCQTQPQS